MNKYLNKLLLVIGVLVIFTSCSTSKSFLSIDYLTPGLLTLPKKSNRIAVLDNAPIDSTVIQSEILKFVNTSRNDIFNGFISALAEDSYFDQIIILDDKWVEPTKPLPSVENLEKIAESVDPDLIIILGRLNAKDEDIVESNEDISATSVISMSPTIYLYNVATTKTTAFQPKDSISLIEPMMLATIHPDIIKKMDNIEKSQGGYVIGKQLAEYLVPHWNTAERVIFTDSPTFNKSKKAFDENKLDEAITECKKEFETNKNIGIRVKAAYNIALIHELKDELNTALEWSNIAVKTIEENTEPSRLKSGSIKDLYKFTQFYQMTIEKRIQDINIINLQMSKFEL